MFKPKKIMSLFLSAVMTLSSFSAVQLSAAAEENDGNAVSSDMTESSFQGNNSIGNMLAGEFEKEYASNQKKESENYAITDLEYDPQMAHAHISYMAEDDCVIFVGFYNDEGDTLYTSATQEVPGGESGTADLYAPVKLPEYYMIKAFIVGLDNRPLSKPYAYKKCTKTMHDILNTSAADLEKKGYNVVALDDDNDKNFLIPSNDAVTIESTSDKNIYKGKDDEGNYIFENPDEDVFKKIKTGSIVFAEEPDEILLFKVKEKKNSGDTVILSPDNDAETTELCDFVKFDSDNAKDCPMEYSSENATEGVEIINYDEQDAEKNILLQEQKEKLQAYSAYLPAIRSLADIDDEKFFSHTFIFSWGEGDPQESLDNRKDLYNLRQDILNDFAIGAKEVQDPNVDKSKSSFSGVRASITLEISMGFYIDFILFDDDFYDIYIDIDNTLQIGMAITKSFDLCLGSFTYPFSYLFNLVITPKIGMWGLGGIFISTKTHSVYSAYGYDWLNLDNYNGTTTRTEPDVVITGNAEFSLKLEIAVCFINEDILKLAVTPEIGIGVEVSLSARDNWGVSSYEKHLCDVCNTGNFYIYVRINVGVDALSGWGKDANRISALLFNHNFAEQDFYISYLDGKVDFGLGECPHKEYKVNVKVKDQKGRLLDGAKIFDSAVSPSIAEDAYNGKSTAAGKPIATTNNGKASFYLPLSDISNLFFSLNAVYKDGENSYVTGSSKIKYDNSEEITKPFEATITLYLYSTEKEKEDEEKEKDANKDTEADNSINVIHGEWNVDDPDNYPVFYDLYPDGTLYLYGNGAIQGDSVRDPFDYHIEHDSEVKQIMIGPNVSLSNEGAGPFQYFQNLELVYFADGNSSKNLSNHSFECGRNLKWILNIPDTVENIGVGTLASTSISFFKCPEQLKTINRQAFWDTLNLKSISFNEKLKKIGESAFDNSGITSVTIPASVKYIGDNAFNSCKNLKTVTINGNPEYCKLDDNLQLESNSPYQNYTFSCCYNLERVNFADSAVNLADGMFNFCTNLKYVRLSPNTKTISSYAFKSSGLSEIDLPEGLETIEDCAFDCTEITEIILPESLETIEKSAFNNTEITEIVLPESLKKIGESAFGWTPIKEVVVPESVESVGESAFTNKNSEPVSITILNPNCELFTDYYGGVTYGIGDGSNTIIYGYKGSTAEAHAKEVGYKFIPLDGESENVTTTAVSTTTTTTTTTTTVVTKIQCTNVKPETECLLISVKDTQIKDTAQSTEDNIVYADRNILELLDTDNVSFFDQTTADENGNAEFTFVLTEENKNNTYIIVGEFGTGAVCKMQGTLEEIVEQKPSIVSEYTTTSTTSATTTTTTSTTSATTTSFTTTATESNSTTATAVSTTSTSSVTSVTTTASVIPTEKKYEYGDVTGDGSIDARDASAVLSEYANTSAGNDFSFTPEQLTAADINKDGKIDARDASLLLSFYAQASTENGEQVLAKFVESCR